jgi:drug/metabolite transporter (DMT)-like permease
MLGFAAAGHRIGSLSVNLIRLPMAFALLATWGALTRGHAVPDDAGSHAWLWLSVSGLVGFTFGDLCLFRAFVVLGPRLSALVMSLAPPIAVVSGWLLLDERLAWRDVAGISLTVLGVGWAALEPHGPARETAGGSLRERASPVGLLLALGGAVGQGGGLVLSKLGLGSYDPFAGTQIRVVAGFVGFSLVFAALGWWRRVPAALADRRALGLTAVGAFFGPFLGVSLSLLAVQHTASGIAASIMATTPILIIPAVVLLHGERVGLAGVGGAALAVGGVALLFH